MNRIDPPRPMTGDRNRDRIILIEALAKAGVDASLIAKSIKSALMSGDERAAAQARADWLKVVGVYSPERVVAEVNKYDDLSYDEVQTKLIEDLEGKGAIPAGSADAYRQSLIGKVRVGALLVDAPSALLADQGEDDAE